MDKSDSADLLLTLDNLRLFDKSSANAVIKAIRCTKLAGLGALSALCVLNSKSKRYGFEFKGAERSSADVARLRCAMDGGLNEESRI